MTRLLRGVLWFCSVTLAFGLANPGAARGQGCIPQYTGNFPGGFLAGPGTPGGTLSNADLYAAVASPPGPVGTTGGSPALYVVGSIPEFGNVARWDGSGWNGLSTGLADGIPLAVAVFDDGQGGGRQVYAGGSFRTAGGLPIPFVARFNGTAWSAVGEGLGEIVRSLIVFNDGNGDALYAGGDFPGGVARWNGTAWSVMGNAAGGLNDRVRALAAVNDGGGAVLFAGGDFTTTGNGAVTLNRVARMFNGQWTALGSGVDDRVFALGGFDLGDGSGPRLYVAGDITTAGGVPVPRVARWDGISWSSPGNGAGATDGRVYALTAFLDGVGGIRLYAGGDFNQIAGAPASRVARFDGAAWSQVGPGFSGLTVRGFAFFSPDNTPSGLRVTAVGDFVANGPSSARDVAQWNTLNWMGLGGGLDAPAFALKSTNANGRPVLYAGGDFVTAGGVEANRVAVYDGARWARLGDGLNARVEGLERFGPGGAESLYAAGDFTGSGATAASLIARWTGTAWVDVGGGLSGFAARRLLVHDDGSGAALFTAGPFSTAGGNSANRIAKWNGTAWSPLGVGLNGGAFPDVYALASFRDSPATTRLFVGGSFTTAGGAPAGNIARWDGAGWAPLGSGLTNSGGGPASVRSLAVYQGVLFVAGFFDTAGGLPAPNGLAIWDGGGWITPGVVAGGLPLAHRAVALRVFDDGLGDGPTLYIAGPSDADGGIRLSRYNGASFAPRGGNLAGGADGPFVVTMTTFDSGSGQDLYLAGSFASVAANPQPTAGPVSAANIARFDGCARPVCRGDFDGNGEVNANDISGFVNAWYRDLVLGTVEADLDGSGETDANDISNFINIWYSDLTSGGC